MSRLATTSRCGRLLAVLFGPLFTISDPIKRQTWRVGGNVPTTERERELRLFMGSRGLIN